MKHFFNHKLAEKLCDKTHGSGLDTEPKILDDSSLRYIQVTWEFHLLDEFGFYDGYWRFILKIPRDNPMGFTLNGRGAGNPRTKSAYGIKEYLTDAFAERMSEILREGGVSFELAYEKIYPGDPDYDADIPFAREHGYHYGRARYEYAGDPQEF
jgi:hypothetical protein